MQNFLRINLIWFVVGNLNVTFMCFSSDAAPRLLQENQKYLSQLTSLMQEAADDQAKSIVVSSLVLTCGVFSFTKFLLLFPYNGMGLYTIFNFQFYISQLENHIWCTSNDSGICKKDNTFLNYLNDFLSNKKDRNTRLQQELI